MFQGCRCIPYKIYKSSEKKSTLVVDLWIWKYWWNQGWRLDSGPIFYNPVFSLPRCLTMFLGAIPRENQSAHWGSENGLKMEPKGTYVFRFGDEKHSCITRWWFQMFFIFTPIWGRFPFWLIFFRWVETTNQIIIWEYDWISTWRVSSQLASG